LLLGLLRLVHFVEILVTVIMAGLVYYLWWRSGEEPDEFTELTDLNEPMPDG
jgi:hypothetical protein